MPPSRLAAGAGVGRQAEILGAGDGAGLDAPQGRQGRRRWADRFGHAPFPAAGPAIAALQPADHAELGTFIPGDAMALGPGGHPQVAGVGPAVAGFLVAPEGGDAELAAGPLQHGFDPAGAYDQGLAQLRQRLAQILEALGAEGPLAGRGIGLVPQLGLHHHQGQHRTLARGLEQRLVIGQPQIPLEPNDLQPLHGRDPREFGPGPTTVPLELPRGRLGLIRPARTQSGGKNRRGPG